MALDSTIRKNWIETQKKSGVPVNAIGMKIDPKDEATLKVWRDEGIDGYMKGRDEVPLPRVYVPAPSGVVSGTAGVAGPRKEISVREPGSSTVDLVRALSAFTIVFLEEMGDRGFGRSNVLKIAEHRLARLRSKFACLEPVRITAEQIDLGPLEGSSTGPEALLAAWRELLAELYRSSVENLGEKTASGKLTRIPAALGERHQTVLRQHNLQETMTRIQWPAS